MSIREVVILKVLKNNLFSLQFLFLSFFIILINFACSDGLRVDKKYQSENVVFENKVDGFKLAGTFTYPQKSGKYPAVILISGRGAQDRDESVGKHRPFFVIAEYLTQNDIAVLRFDDRGFGQSEGEFDFNITTKSNIVTDVIAAFEYINHRSEIDTQHIGLIGHSEGGIIAAMVSDKISNIGFIILMASSGLNGAESLALQIGLIARSFGISESTMKKYQDIFQHMNEIQKIQNNNEVIQQNIFKMYSELSAKIRDDERNSMKNLGYYLPEDPSVFINIFKTPGWNDFYTYEPKTIYQKIKCPILVMNGDKDLQVPSTNHLDAIINALEKGVNMDYTVLELQGLNHLFQTARTGSPSEYERINETISSTVLKIMKEWIVKHVR